MAGTNFSWTVVSTGSVSGQSAGSGSLIIQTLSGSGTVIYTITPEANGCVGNSRDVVVTVDTEAPTITSSFPSQTVVPNQGCTFENSSSSNNYIDDNEILTDHTTDNCSVMSIEYVFTGATTGTVNTLENQIFNEGETTVTWVAIDAAGNSSLTSSFTVTVIDSNEPPVLTPMQNFTRNTDATNCFYTNRTTNTTQRIPDGRATDNCGVASYRYLLSGATLGDVSSLEAIRFNIGVTNVSWTATDRNGNTSSPNQFTITIEDAQAPTIEAPQDITLPADLYACVATRDSLNIGMPIVSDNCLFRVFNDAPVQLPLGETVVVWTAIDSAGNTSTDEQIVIIEPQFYVAPSDSLILVEIYNEMGGQNWNRPWNLEEPVATWTGLGVDCRGITSINLSNNNLIGTLPNSVLNLERRRESDFALNIGGNKLNFASAENFVGAISNFTYYPQDKIYNSRTETVRQSESITLTSETEGRFNQYQWYKDQNLIAGATNATLEITSAVPSDAGVYVCQITNTVATALTLERRPITLEVGGFINSTDSLALVRIFEDTGGSTTWTQIWDLTQPVATWQGVTIVGDKVRELDLSSRNLTGTLPDVFDAELFLELRYLSFFDNELEGEIPSSLGDITTLTYLDLDKNNFEGAIPASFGNLTNLQSLWLSRNNLTELPNEIGNLQNLRTLYLNDNNFASLPETIGNLSELLVLNVSDNELSELPNALTNLTKLQEFYANRNFIALIPSDIRNILNLRTFEMNANNLQNLPSGLLELSNLSTFRVAENELEFDDLLPFVSRYSIFDYAPQAPIGEEEEVLAVLNSSVSFTVPTEGNGNVYQWLRDGNSVASTQNFTINSVKNEDIGVYTALITNSSLPNLTLQRRSVTLNVECQDGLSLQIEEPTEAIFCEGQPFGLKLEIDEAFDNARQIRWKKDGIVLAFADERAYTVTSAGAYTAEVLTTDGCTILSNTIEITVLPQPEISIELVNEEVFTSTVSSQETVTYQWLKDGVIIENATENTYTPTETGEYSLLVRTATGCTSVSETIIFTQTITGVEEPIELRNLNIFPNPNNGKFFIDFGTNTPNGEPIFTLIDAIGRKIALKTKRISSTQYQVETTNLTGGIYYLQIQTEDGFALRKFVIEE